MIKKRKPRKNQKQPDLLAQIDALNLRIAHLTAEIGKRSLVNPAKPLLNESEIILESGARIKLSGDKFTKEGEEG